jgi:hypothetical protein
MHHPNRFCPTALFTSGFLCVAALAVGFGLAGCDVSAGAGLPGALGTGTGTVIPARVTVRGSIPATTGVPSVLVDGQPATIIDGTTWTSDVPMATAMAGTMDVQFFSDGTLIATKELRVNLR